MCPHPLPVLPEGGGGAKKGATPSVMEYYFQDGVSDCTLLCGGRLDNFVPGTRRGK